MRPQSMPLLNAFKKFTSLANQKKGRPTRSKKRSGTAYDVLEPRKMLATLSVTTAIDSLDGGTDGQISLREAIIAANTNEAYGDAPAGDAGLDTIVFAPEVASSTFTLDGSPLLVTEELSIRARNGDVTITTNGNSQIFVVDTDQTVILDSLKLTNNFSGGNASVSGNLEDDAAISNLGSGELRLVGSDVFNNGGLEKDTPVAAVYNKGGLFQTIDSRFTGNSAFGGSAIYSEGGDVIVVSTSFEDNSGGAIHLNDGTHFIFESTFTNNINKGPSVEISSISSNEETPEAEIHYGGALHLDGAANTIVRASTFDGNQADFGGAIYNGSESRLFVQQDSVLKNNEAIIPPPVFYMLRTGHGGAIYSLGTLRLDDVTLSSNSSARGGAISVEGRTVINRSTIEDNFAVVGGGGIRAVGSILMSESVVRGNSAGAGSAAGSGGGIWLVTEVDGETSTLNFFAGEISENTVVDGRDIQGLGFSFATGGGGISGSGALNIYQGAKIENNTGGGIDFRGNLYLKDAIVRENFRTNATTLRGASGDGIRASGRAIIRDSTISANAGAGILIPNSSADSATELYVSDSTIGGPTKDDGNGHRGLSLGWGATVGLFSAIVENNQGGGLSADLRATVAIRDSVFRSNTFGGSGGGIELEGATLFAVNSSFIGNSAGRDGGAIYSRDTVEPTFVPNSPGILRSSAVWLRNVVVRENQAGSSGGGLYLQGRHGLFDSDISDNTAPENADIFALPPE